MTMYHVSPRRNRDSILARGLLLSETASRFVWLFERHEDALRAQGQRWGCDPHPDLYAVDVAGLELAPDPHPGFDPPLPCWVSSAPIALDRVTLA